MGCVVEATSLVFRGSSDGCRGELFCVAEAVSRDFALVCSCAK